MKLIVAVTANIDIIENFYLTCLIFHANFRKASFVKTYGGDNYEENDDPNLDKYKDFLFAPDDLPVYAAYPKVSIT